MIEQKRVLAEIAVENTVYHFDKLFSYAVPDSLMEFVSPGVRVSVPFGFGNKLRVGIVVSLNGAGGKGIKSISAVLDAEPVLSDEMIKLALWMKDRYFCTYFNAVRPMLPTGMDYRLCNSYKLSGEFKNFDREYFSELQWAIIMFLKTQKKPSPFEKISKNLSVTEASLDFIELLNKDVIVKVNTTATKIKDAVVKMVRPVSDFSGKLSTLQQSVYNTLLEIGSVSEKELSYFTGASSAVIKALTVKGAAEFFEYEVYRRPEVFEKVLKSASEIILTDEQQTVFDKLKQEYNEFEGVVSLLFGITGSGKTSVFIKLIDYVINLGKEVIVMVPEIALTAQTIKLFSETFGDIIAVFHSGLSFGERLDEWKRVKRGKVKIVIGTRSAVFAPFSNLGLIVIDEEQEHTYKSESAPRYDAREVAKWRCNYNKAFGLLSSATPSLESFYMAQNDKYLLNKLENRFGEAKIPIVELVDMNEEVIEGNTSLISRPLFEALQENYDNKKQSIILLNRRGYHTFASCKECHKVRTCPHCSISLTYHSANRRLMCHYCGYSVEYSSICPECGNDAVTFRGFGTQRAEEQLKNLLPNTRILRIDTDSVSGQFSLEKKLVDFANGEYDIIVGTQMVAKGLNFENVTLVGVLTADQMLYNDDFRSNERTFDLLTQVVGRAGRGKFEGKALVQTFMPENPVIHLASEQDYIKFYDSEIEFRKAMLYPPYVDILVVAFVGENEEQTHSASRFFLNSLSVLAKAEYSNLPLRVLSPSPATINKISNKYRYKLIVKCKNTAKLREMISSLLIDISKNKDFSAVTAYADMNPYIII